MALAVLIFSEGFGLAYLGRDDPASSAFQLSSRVACAKCRIGVRSWYHLLIRVVGKDEKRKPITVKGLLDNGSELTIL